MSKPSTPDPVRTAILLCLLWVTAFRTLPVSAADVDLSVSDRLVCEQEAEAGNARSAYRLYQFHKFQRHDHSGAMPWLRRAAELGHPQAQRSLALGIKNRNPGYSHVGFGANAADAVRFLLDRASHTVGSACHELGTAFVEGYFGEPDLDRARLYYHRGALLNDRMCWQKLSEYLASGKGGAVNRSEAYYWIALETRCTDPRSVGGEEHWAAREEIAQHLSLDELQRQWERIDSFIARVTAKEVEVDYAPFLSGMIDPKLEEEGRRFSDESEKEHRAKWKRTKGGP